MIAGCFLAIIVTLCLVAIIAILRENHELRKTIGELEISRQNLLVQIKLDQEIIARGEALNQSMKARVFELKEKISEMENK